MKLMIRISPLAFWLEYEAFNGIVVKLLRQAGNDAPVNRVLYGTLEYLDKKIRQEAPS